MHASTSVPNSPLARPHQPFPNTTFTSLLLLYAQCSGYARLPLADPLVDHVSLPCPVALSLLLIARTEQPLGARFDQSTSRLVKSTYVGTHLALFEPHRPSDTVSILSLFLTLSTASFLSSSSVCCHPSKQPSSHHPRFIPRPS